MLEAGAEDLQKEGEQFIVLTDPSAYTDVCHALETAEIATASSEVTLLPTLPVPIADVAVARQVLRFVGDLEDNDDVQDVYTSMDMSDDVIAQVSDEA